MILISVVAVTVYNQTQEVDKISSNNLTTTFSNGVIVMPRGDIPAFAKLVASQSDDWSSVNFNGLVISKPQALYILSTAVSENSSDDISVGVILQADKSYGALDSGNISQEEYLDMSDRVSQGIIDKGDKCPMYAGVRVKGEADVSYDKLVKLFALVICKDYPDSISVSSL